ncbi:hypothetical protein HNQ60_001727 [Povalibacter uvarum]|uniref:DUF4349 domain-containing protein n=1 Tax=Povalibacter uvarum TaxID=732238 RepID=A0A841HKD9_9GAMM|nr:DUF4349 domain-containing protein [Povalibacter uvarum]MBB6092849.1 hypothetical protein [Povalibacter uvarum]
MSASIPTPIANRAGQALICLGLGLVVLALGGCTKKPGTSAESSFGLAANYASPAPAIAAQATRRISEIAEDSSLAYEHSVSIELPKEVLPNRMKEIQSACQSDAQSGCTLLDVSISASERVPSGNLRMRLAPGGVEPLLEAASKGGEITSRNTHAEDLAESVADTERRLALLTVHRDRLAEFMKDKSLKVEQLITVSRELADVQTQLEQAATTRANLRRRIDTELLTIYFSVPVQDSAAEQSPIFDALRDFGSTLRETFGMVIRFIATLLPWLLVIVPGLILIRWLWRRISLWLNRREQRPA